MTAPHMRPPGLARLLLRVRSVGLTRHDIESDLDDLFQRRAASHGVRYARRRYWKDVLSVATRRAVDATPAAGQTSITHRLKMIPQTIGQDLRHAARLFRHQPAAVATAVGGLGVSLAVATCIFSILNTALLRPAGIADPDALVRVMRTYKNGIATTIPFDEYRELRAQSHLVTLEAATGTSKVEVAIDGRGPAAFLPVSFVSGSFLSTFGATMHAGRAITTSDDLAGAPPVAIVSYGYWLRQLSADPTIIGTTLALNGTRFVIVGVADRAFRGPAVDPPAYWVPIATYGQVYGSVGHHDPPSDVNVWGSLSTGSTLERAQAETQAVAAALVARTSNPDGRVGVRLDTSTRFAKSERSTVWIAIGLVMLAIALILLLACANLANLLLAHASTRAREISVRLALGATRWRLIRQLLTEGLALGALSGLVGWVLATWSLPLLTTAARFPATLDFSPDARVYLFVALASLLAGAGAGLAPALHGTRGQLATPLRTHGGSAQTSRRSGRMRTILVATQAGACVVLVVLGALLTRSVSALARTDVGLDIEHLVAVSPALDERGYDAPRAATFFSASLDRIRALPGIHSAALALNPPLGHRVWSGLVTRGERTITVHFNETSPEYFETVGLRLIAGRSLATTDAPGAAQAVVVSAALAREIGVNPLGVDVAQVSPVLNHGIIVGVVADALTANIRDRDAWYVYQPLSKTQQTSLSILVRTNGDPHQTIGPLQDALRAIDPAIRIEPKPVADSFDEALTEVRVLALVATTLGGLALCLAVTGIYGVTAYTVSQRTREIGVRLAIGASSRQILGLVVREGLRPIVVGLAAGAVLAAAAGRLLSSLLAGISGGDPVSFAAAIVLLIAAAVVAILVPARRVLRLDPASVLRD